MKSFARNYPSDISREQFEIVRPELENAKKATKPREIDLYSVFCAILYLNKSGCQWRMILCDFPKRGIALYYYDVWSKERGDGTSVLQDVLKKIGGDASQR